MTRSFTRILDLGCGLAKKPGAVGLDSDPNVRPDILHDLEQLPYPLPSDQFDLIICQDVLEHVANTEGFLREVHRVAVRGALVQIRTPHFSSWYAYNDPTHQHVFGYFALDRFTTANPADPRATHLFAYTKRKLLFSRVHRIDGVSVIANRFPSRYEQLFAFILPAENLCIELEVLK